MTGKETDFNSNTKTKQKEIDRAKIDLKELNKQKEKFFQHKKSISEKISQLLQERNEARKKRNQSTNIVKSSKERRGILNQEIKDKIEELKKLQIQKKEIAKKMGISVDLSKLKREIEQLEFKIETEVRSFTQEQKIMKIKCMFQTLI